MENQIYTKVYGWMFIGLFISFLTGYFLSLNEEIVYTVMLTNYFWFVVIIELGLALFFGLKIATMKKTTATLCYLLYCLTTGFTLSIIFIAYETLSILSVFVITATLFGAFAVYGALTKKDITKWGTYLIMALLGIIVATFINMIFNNTTVDLLICIIGIVVFLLFVAYDMQKVKQLMNQIPEDNAAIYGAFSLYLDFINLFLKLIRIFGKSRD